MAREISPAQAGEWLGALARQGLRPGDGWSALEAKAAELGCRVRTREETAAPPNPLDASDPPVAMYAVGLDCDGGPVADAVYASSPEEALALALGEVLALRQSSA